MMQEAIVRLGFDPSKLAFGLRTAIAASLGLALAWVLGLEHPQWSAMTVWAASQPLRGHLLEKSLARLAGTIIGALFGVALMLMSSGQPVLLVTSIALWIGICAFIGNLLRGYASYASMLSGYTAAMVMLLDAVHPEHVLEVGSDRVLTVALGILAALIVGLLFAALDDDIALIARTRHLSSRVLADITARLRRESVLENDQRSILSELAALEGTLDLQSAGSRQRRRLVKKVRALLAAQVAAALWLRSDTARESADPILKEAGARAASEPARALELLRIASARVSPNSDLTLTLNDLAGATSQLDDLESDSAAELQLHRDWRLAWRAMLRAVIALLAAGTIWLTTGWEMGGYLMLGAAIMLSIFSTLENPALMMRHVLIGQLLGTGFALICRWLAWPFANEPVELIVAMMPFILLGAPLFAHRVTQRIAFDYNMVLLLMLQPVWPQTMKFEQSIMASLAVAGGPVVALFAFHLIYPVDSRRRYESVRRSMIDDLEHLAANALRSARRRRWRALLHHRVLLAAYWGERASLPAARLAEDALALFCVAQAIERLAEFAATASSDSGKRCVTTSLRRLHRVGADPVRAARALLAAARRLSSETSGGTHILAQAAGKLIQRPTAFRRLQVAAD